MNSPAGHPVTQKRKRFGDVVQLLRQPIYSRKLIERIWSRMMPSPYSFL